MDPRKLLSEIRSLVNMGDGFGNDYKLGLIDAMIVTLNEWRPNTDDEEKSRQYWQKEIDELRDEINS